MLVPGSIVLVMDQRSVVVFGLKLVLPLVVRTALPDMSVVFVPVLMFVIQYMTLVVCALSVVVPKIKGALVRALIAGERMVTVGRVLSGTMVKRTLTLCLKPKSFETITEYVPSSAAVAGLMVRTLLFAPKNSGLAGKLVPFSIH